MSDILEFVLTKDTEEYVIVSSGVAGGPGPRGERGPSATPGVEVSDPYVTETGHVAFDIITHYGITATGQAYYVSHPSEIPPGEEAYLDVDTLTLMRGGPGADASTSSLVARGDWVRNTQYDINDLFRYNNRIYRVLSPFRSGTSFDETNVQLFLGSPEGTGVTYLGDLNTQIHQDQVGRYIVYGTALTQERSLVLSRFRNSADQTQLIDEGTEYVIVRRNEAVGNFALVVRNGDVQGAANEIARLQPGNWVHVKYDRNNWLLMAAGPLATQGAYVKPPSGIPNTDLDSEVRGKLNLATTAVQVAPVTSVNGQTGDVLITTGGEGADVGDASASIKGLVRLAGHLAGTADEPTVPGLAAKADLTDPRFSDTRIPKGAAGGVLAGNYPSPTFAQQMATKAQLDTLAAQVAALISPFRVLDGPPTDSPADGQLPTIDKTNNRLYVRVNGSWRYIALQGP